MRLSRVDHRRLKSKDVNEILLVEHPREVVGQIIRVAEYLSASRTRQKKQPVVVVVRLAMGEIRERAQTTKIDGVEHNPGGLKRLCHRLQQIL